MSAHDGQLLDLVVEVPVAAVLRELGYRGGHASERVRRRLERVGGEAAELLRPRGAWRTVAGTRAAALGVPVLAPQVGLGVSTIGPALEAEAARRSSGDELLDALLLEAFGSAAAEATADALNRQLCAAARSLGLHAGVRVSPGYPGWGLEHQEELLSLLSAFRLGVTLTAGLMMVPRKSVSFAVPFLTEPPEPELGPCRRCNRRECAFADR